MSMARGEIRKLLRFFRSDRLAIYTDIPGDEIIALLRTRDLNKSFIKKGRNIVGVDLHREDDYEDD